MNPAAVKNSSSPKVLVLSVILALGLGGTGCANIQDDATRTKTEGTLTGAGVGAVIGAGVGALIGNGRGAMIGAALGASIGSISGYFIGKHIADRKAEFANQEDWLDACIDRSRQVTADTKEYNKNLKKEVADLDRESRRLTAKKAGTDEKDVISAKRDTVQQLSAQNEENIKSLEAELLKQKEVAADARQNGSNREARILDEEIRKLQKQIKEMKSYNTKLANISARLAV